MSGHNKWSKIKHKKGAADAARSKVFGKLAQLIALESKKCCGNVDSPGLRSVIDRAKAASMPKSNIERAIVKGSGAEGANFEEVTYEAYGPGGVALIIEAITDNKNRTTPEIRHILSKQGLELAASGSATWAFTKGTDGYKSNSTTEISESDGEKLKKLLEIFDEHDDVQEVYTNAT
ncbi:MAG: YebC/PmpR family DNA-binding transcriptional regulator [Candidatus Pacebacteria bacterium]|nr:YebC/PmpR family DNA-binding transcriptional regulator [Candidatus Paceibacterota bacterium]